MLLQVTPGQLYIIAYHDFLSLKVNKKVMANANILLHSYTLHRIVQCRFGIAGNKGIGE